MNQMSPKDFPGNRRIFLRNLKEWGYNSNMPDYEPGAQQIEVDLSGKSEFARLLHEKANTPPETPLNEIAANGYEVWYSLLESTRASPRDLRDFLVWNVDWLQRESDDGAKNLVEVQLKAIAGLDGDDTYVTDVVSMLDSSVRTNERAAAYDQEMIDAQDASLLKRLANKLGISTEKDRLMQVKGKNSKRAVGHKVLLRQYLDDELTKRIVTHQPGYDEVARPWNELPRAEPVVQPTDVVDIQVLMLSGPDKRLGHLEFYLEKAAEAFSQLGIDVDEVPYQVALLDLRVSGGKKGFARQFVEAQVGERINGSLRAKDQKGRESQYNQASNWQQFADLLPPAPTSDFGTAFS